MKYTTLALLTVILFSSRTIAQSGFDTSAVIKQEAKKMCDGFMQSDFKTLAKFTYPKIVEMMGGAEKMDATLKKSFADMASQDITFLSVSTGGPSKIIHEGKEWQCTVPETIKMKVKGGTLLSNSTLIAVSFNGKTWYFIDTSNHTLAELRQALPNISNRLTVPAKQQPTFIPG